MKFVEHLSKRGDHHFLLACLFVVLGVLSARTASATEYYVSPTGSDSNPGTLASPFATIQKGANTAVAGDTVWLRGGTYTITTPTTSGAGITFTKSGTSDTNRINYFAYTGETPVIDFSNMQISTSGYTHGIHVTGSWLHFKGIEEHGVPMNTFSNNGWAVDGGGNDIFELLNMHHNSGNGIFIGKGTGGHLVLNCDGHDNYDATSAQGQGQNADGFGVHYQTSGPSTILRGNRSWWNSDDCYDLINQEVPVTVENNWAFGCGFADYGTFNPSSGNGNGFKMGSSATGVRHLVQNNVAWKNKASGFYANHSSGGNTWYNNTSFQNGTQFNMLASPPNTPNTTIILTGTAVHIMRNNVGYPNKNTNMGGVDTQFNAWDLNITPKATDFLSITDPTVSGTGLAIETTSPALGPRQADGSLPNVDFLKLAAGSQMIDKGTDVGLPFVGTAPDLGAYEFGATGTAGAGGGGTTGTGAGGAVTGGATAAGGSTGSGSGGAGGGGLGGSSGTLGSGGATAPNNGGSAVVATGGTPAPGGALASGGGAGGRSAASGGSTVAAGGAEAVATGGALSTAFGGSMTAGSGAGGAAAGQSGTVTTSSGCSCALGATSTHGGAVSLVALFGVLGLVLGRRRRR